MTLLQHKNFKNSNFQNRHVLPSAQVLKYFQEKRSTNESLDLKMCRLPNSGGPVIRSSITWVSRFRPRWNGSGRWWPWNPARCCPPSWHGRPFCCASGRRHRRLPVAGTQGTSRTGHRPSSQLTTRWPTTWMFQNVYIINMVINVSKCWYNMDVINSLKNTKTSRFIHKTHTKNYFYYYIDKSWNTTNLCPNFGPFSPFDKFVQKLLGRRTFGHVVQHVVGHFNVGHVLEKFDKHGGWNTHTHTVHKFGERAQKLPSLNWNHKKFLVAPSDSSISLLSRITCLTHQTVNSSTEFADETRWRRTCWMKSIVSYI